MHPAFAWPALTALGTFAVLGWAGYSAETQLAGIPGDTLRWAASLVTGSLAFVASRWRHVATSFLSRLTRKPDSTTDTQQLEQQLLQWTTRASLWMARRGCREGMQKCNDLHGHIVDLIAKGGRSRGKN